jgi:hypothetical protein
LDSFRIKGFTLTGSAEVEDVVFVTLSFAARGFFASMVHVLFRERRLEDKWL